MIIDLEKFVSGEQPFWRELDKMVARQEDDPHRHMSFEQIKRLHYLYRRASADLAKINTFSADHSMRLFLESLVGRSYALIYGAQTSAVRFSPFRWFRFVLPQTFRRQWKAFVLSVAIMMVGSLFGGVAIVADPEAKAVLMPFEHLQMDPSERVAREESASDKDRMGGAKGSFSAFLMTHNTQVSIMVLALGMTWGIGTVLLLFSNGVMLGAVAADYIRAGETTFLLGWLLPHGVVEIPAILVAGQAGLLLAAALLGHSSAKPIGERLRDIVPDVVTLISGVAVMLVWAGIIEAFFSQYHEPVMPYSVKIAFGVVEFVLLFVYLIRSGRRQMGVSIRRRAALRRKWRSLFSKRASRTA